MNLEHALQILIKGKNQAGPALGEAGSQVANLVSKVLGANVVLKTLSGVVEAALTRLFRVVKTLTTGLLGLVAGITSLAAAFIAAMIPATKYASQLEAANRAFLAVAQEGAPAMLESLRATSNFMLDDLTIQRQYVRAYMLTGEELAKRLPEAYQYLSKVAIATGDDLDFLAERLYRSVGRLSTRWMAYIGTVVTTEEATAKAVEMFDKEAEALNNVELRAAMFERVMEKLEIRTRGLPEAVLSTEQRWLALRSVFQNFAGTMGTTFTPAAREVLSLLTETVLAVDRLVSKGGALYNFFRTVSATATVVAEGLRAIVNDLLGLEGALHDGLERMANNILSWVWQAFSWGVNISTQLAAGMIRGAATALTAAMNFISSLLAAWLAPGSPPRVAPNIDKWGMEAMYEWLKGFTMVSFDILEGIQAPLERVLSALVSSSAIDRREAAEIYLGITESLTSSMEEFVRTGKMSGEIFRELTEVGGDLGRHLIELARRQLTYSRAVNRLERATRGLKEAQQELEDSQTSLNKSTDRYYLMLVEKASYAELKAQRETVRAARERKKRADASLDAAEIEKEAAEGGVEDLRERLKLQQRLVDQLVNLYQKQSELVMDEETARKAREARERAGAGGALEGMLEPLAEPLGGALAKIDAEFENLKDSIRLKFAELWADIKRNWDESGVGQAIGGLQTALMNLKNFIDENGPVISEKIEKIVGPIREWIREDLFSWVGKEWQKWVTWWQETGEGELIGAVESVVEALTTEFTDLDGDVTILSVSFSLLGEAIETVLSSLRTFATVALQVIQGDWLGVLATLAGLRDEIAETLYKPGPNAEQYIDNWYTFQQTNLQAKSSDFSDVGAGLASRLVEGFEIKISEQDSSRVFMDFLPSAAEFSPLIQRKAIDWVTEWETGMMRTAGHGGPGPISVRELFMGYFPKIAEALAHGTEIGESVGEGTSSGLSGKVFRVERAVDDTLHRPVEGFRNFWSETVWPEILNVFNLSWDDLESGFGEIKTWLETTLVEAFNSFKTVWEGTESGWPSILKAVHDAWLGEEGISVIFEEIMDYFYVRLHEALSDFYWYWIRRFEIINAGPGAVLMTLDKIKRRLEELQNWAENNEIVLRVGIAGDPAAIPHSPLPIHTAWKNFADYASSLNVSLGVGTNLGGLDLAETSRRQDQPSVYIERVYVQGVRDAPDLIRQLQGMTI